MDRSILVTTASSHKYRSAHSNGICPFRLCRLVLAILVLSQGFSQSLFGAPKAHGRAVKPAASPGLLNLTLSPVAAVFPTLTVGTTSYPVTLTLTNNAINGVVVNAVSVSGDFAQSNNCAGTTMAVGAQCYIYVTFSPTAIGDRTGTLTLTESTGASVSFAALAGFGLQAGAGSTFTDIWSTGSAGAYTLNGVVVGTLTNGWPTGPVSFLDASNGNLSVGSATLSQPYSGIDMANGPSEGTGVEPSGVVTADFNGDGKMDLAVLNNGGAPCSGPYSVSIWIGSGDGTLTAKATVPLGNCANSIVIGDFNGDHKIDIAVDGGPNSVTVLLGNGDGTFTSTSIPVSNSAGFLATGDFNGDGTADLAVVTGTEITGTAAPYSATILLGQSNRTFVPKPAGPALSAYSIVGVVAGDFDGDGTSDIAIVGDNSGSTPYSAYVNVAVLLGNGDGTLRPAVVTDANQSSFVPLMLGGQLAAAGDFNGDGKSDLVIGGALNGVAAPDAILVLLSKGDGSFTVQPPITTDAAGQGSVSVSVVTADFDGDGKIDIASLNDNSVQVYLGIGDGTFTPNAYRDSGAETVPDWLALAVGDFNGDGEPDLAFVNSDADLASLMIVQRIRTATATLQNVSIPGSGTHNIEGRYEGDGTFAPSISTTVPLTASPSATQLALSSSTATSGSGAQVVLTATLSPYLVGTLSTAGENVTFLNNGTSIGAAPLSAGIATFNVTSLPVGTDNLTATYAGDNNFKAANAAAIAVAVAAAPFATVTPASLTFNAQAVGSTSSAQAVTLANTGAAALTITSIAISGDFAQTNTCGSSLAPGTSCTVAVTFAPSAGGSRMGTLTISDNFGGSPQTVSLTGTGSAVTLASTSTALSIASSGGSATATIQLSSAGGFSAAVSLACTVAYQGTGTPADPPTCELAPAQVTVSNVAATTTLTVSTTAATSARLESSAFGFGGASFAALFLFALVPRRRFGVAVMLAVLCLGAACATVGCGGSAHPPSNPGTTAGSYKATVTATSGTLTASLTIPLSVQ